MILRTLRLHRFKWLLLTGYLPLSLLAAALVGDPVRWEDVHWLDVFGEGGGALMVLTWSLLILGSRPAGTVSNLLFIGLSLILVTLWQDNLDEFWTIPDAQLWDTWLENIPMPVGMAVLTLGLVRWYEEQRVLMAQLSQRERFMREHRSIDPVTRLASADYLNQQLAIELRRARRECSPVSLMMLDLDGFDLINRRFGAHEGDRLLQAVTELLLLNLRDGDLLCRYAADRFAIMLPQTSEAMADLIASELTSAIRHFAYRSSKEGERVTVTASAGVALALSASPEELMQRANRALSEAKQTGSGCHAMAG
ncbi:GGDEF domain-containing protein [Vreelandella utahensis]|uniref:GGDEF domain-containing protein n=1 Tax=Vreelandella halophila TaxID=86177 RepID=UPI0009869DCB|nr:GGDEF domain-containing protein [Halomonas utahensis]